MPERHRTLVVSVPAGLAGRTVGDAMLREPKLAAPTTTVAELRTNFEDDHVHAVLVVDRGGLLLSVVEREDLHGVGPREPVTALGRLRGRTLRAETDLVRAWLDMIGTGRRRLAVVEPDTGTLLGLLCLKQSGLGFCTDAGVAERGSAPVRLDYPRTSAS